MCVNSIPSKQVTVTRLIRISYGDYELHNIPRGLAIEVPYKPIEKQKSKGSLFSNDDKRRRQERKRRQNDERKASPIKWVTSVQ